MTTIELKTPVSKGERKVTSLTFQDPKLKHFIRTDDKTGFASDRALLSALTGEPESLLDEISAEDWPLIRAELERVWFRFFGVTDDKENAEENPPQAEHLPPKSAKS